MRIGAFALVLTMSIVSTTQAATLTVSDSIPIQTTNFNSSVSIPRFDPSLGTLQNVQFHLEGTVQGAARFESHDASPTTVTMNLQSMITLQRPDLSTLLVALPLVQTIDSVTAFDNLLDFAGLSGRTYTGLTNTDSVDTFGPTSLSDLALFTGLTNIVLPVVASGTSNGSGAGNLLLQFNTSAGANVGVTYTYAAAPEPASLAMLAIGTLFLRRRRARA